jgi:hypothetical protein
MIAGVPRDAAVSSLSPESVSNNDLLIVGPGVLGRIVAEMWKQVATLLNLIYRLSTSPPPDERAQLVNNLPTGIGHIYYFY